MDEFPTHIPTFFIKYLFYEIDKASQIEDTVQVYSLHNMNTYYTTNRVDQQ